MISDSIGDRLAAEAERLPRARARLTLAVALVPALAALVGASGAVVPRFGYGDGGGGSSSVDTYETGETYVTTEVEQGVVNEGWTLVTVTGVGVRGEGLVLREVSGARLPRAVAPGEELPLTLAFDVEDCGAVRAKPPEVVLEVSRWWGSSAVTVAADELDGPENWVAVESACDSPT
ncbi:hypothetical protein [Nonomuraea sp. NPDC050691]|uniref:hypothetical protein n=1 Tax=Nonomuraea sp. NPDC050691 TaxID=3155661 RepID=UPI003408800A